MKIVVVGMGYAGIPSAALFANVNGITVAGLQRKSQRSGWKIDCLNQGKSPIGGDEPGLAELINKVVKEDQLKATDDSSVYSDADVILIDVQTPVNKYHTPDYDSLKNVCREAGKKMNNGVLFGVESTVAPGTTENIVKPILEGASGMEAGADFNLIYSYERVMAGRLLYNLQYLPRIVGGHTAKCAKRGAELYSKINKTEIFQTDCLTAETCKTVENAYRDVNIAFANEIALICESLGADVNEVRRYVNNLPFDPRDPAKNPYRMMLEPGAGVGGHCLPKDSWLLKYGVDNFGTKKVNPNIIIQSRITNDYMPFHMKNLVIEALKENGIELEKSKITILGYAFLENSGDTRNTPAQHLYNSLDKAKELVVHDPNVRDFEGVNYTKDLEKALINSDCLALVTKHKEYLTIDLQWLKETMRTPIIVDGRNLFNRFGAENLGFTYKGIGIGHKP